jgi:uncharacterized membrane protein
MSLYFENSYSATATISVCVLYYNTGCPNPWTKIGWYNVAPGQTVQMWDGDVSSVNEYWYFWAQATDGSVWAGSAVFAEVTDAAFNQCWLDNSGDSFTVGMLEIDVNSYDDYTVNLVPASGIPWDNFSNFTNFTNFTNSFDNWDDWDDFSDNDNDDNGGDDW